MERNVEENQQLFTRHVRFLHYGPCLFCMWQIPFFKSGKSVLNHIQDGHCLLVHKTLWLVIYLNNLRSVYSPGQVNLHCPYWEILCTVSLQTLLPPNSLWRIFAITASAWTKFWSQILILASSWLFDFLSFPLIPALFIIEIKSSDYYSVFITMFSLVLISIWYGNATAQRFAIDLLAFGTRNLSGEKPCKCHNEPLAFGPSPGYDNCAAQFLASSPAEAVLQSIRPHWD